MSLERLKEKIATQKAAYRPNPLSSEGIEPNRKRTDVVVNRPAPVVLFQPQAPEPTPVILGVNGQPLRRPAPPMAPGWVPKPIGEPEVIQAPNPPHVLITMQDCGCEPGTYCHVCDGGLSVCRVCGEYEAGLDNPCKPKEPTPPPTRPFPKLAPSQAEALLKGGHNVLAVPLPMGYMALGKNDRDALMWCKAQIILSQIMGFDYETDGDPDDETTDPQDHTLVGVSFSWKVGFAVYLPIAHENYGANWDWQELRSIFLKPLLEDPDIMLIAHNVKQAA